MGWDAIPNVIDKILSHFSPEERKRRLRDELDKLQTEKAKIMVFKASENNSKRLAVIQRRIDVILRLLKND